MNSARISGLLTLALTALGPASAAAQRLDIPLNNWTVPPYSSGASGGGLVPMTDITPGVGFVGVQPCRIVDTRGGGVFTGAYGPPIMAANSVRSFDLNSAPHCTGIPAGVDAYSLNFTVTETAGASGDIRAWPTGNPPAQVTSVLNWTQTNAVVANATIVPAGTGGSVDVQVAGSNTHLLIDINGYFTDEYNAGVQLVAIGSMGGDGMIVGTNSAAVADSAGVKGSATGAARSYGVLGIKPGNSNGAAGVKGVQGAAVQSAPFQAPAGVVGTSTLFDGVLGITIAGSGGAGVKGLRTSGDVGIQTSGELGVANYGGRFQNDVQINSGDLFVGDDGTQGDGEFNGDLTVIGMKNFIEPHPTDASKAIRYVSLEGPESGTYFRGRGRFQNGVGRISVPEDFRLVTAEEGLTVQITPIGGMATVGVLKMDLNEIVAQSSRNLEFSYLVQGVRRAFRDFQPIEEAGIRFARAGSNARLPEIAPELKRRLVENGTYNADGSVNMDTAWRLGWDRIWAEREREEPPDRQSH